MSSVKRKVVKTGRWTFEAKKERDGDEIYMLDVTKYNGTPISAEVNRITKNHVTTIFLKCNPGDNRAVREQIVRRGKTEVKGFAYVIDTELVLVYPKDTIPDVLFYEAVNSAPKKAFETVKCTNYKPIKKLPMFKRSLMRAGYVDI